MPLASTYRPAARITALGDAFYDESADKERYAGARWDALRRIIHPYESERGALAPYFDCEKPCTLLIDEVEAVWGAIAERNDWAPLYAKIAAIREMGAALGD